MLKFAGDRKVDKYAEEVIRTLSNYPISVSHGIVAANIIEEMIMRNSQTTSDEIIESVKEKIEQKFPDAEQSICNVRKHIKVDHLTAVGDVFGRPCYNPGSFQVVQK